MEQYELRHSVGRGQYYHDRLAGKDLSGIQVTKLLNSLPGAKILPFYSTGKDTSKNKRENK